MPSRTQGHVIRDVRSADRRVWQDLWEAYLVFYEASLPPGNTDRLWERIFDETDPITCLVAEASGEVVGIAQFYTHADTWEDGPVCYLQDLYVAETHRRVGIGRSLILEVRRRCAENGWRRLHWQTMHDNRVARTVYDALTGGTNGFIEYEIDTR